MHLFFGSKKVTPPSTDSTGGALLVGDAWSFAAGRTTRFRDMCVILISEQDGGVINLSGIQTAATLLEEFEISWNVAERSVESATNMTFKLLDRLFNVPSLRKIISDKCLTDFFSGVVELEKCLNFEKLNKDEFNLMTMSTLLSYVQLSLCFFEAQIQPYWSLPANDFFQNIFYRPPERNRTPEINKITSLLFLSEVVFKSIQSNKERPEPSEDLFFLMQGHLRHIRSIISKIFSYPEAFSVGVETTTLRKAYDMLLASHEKPICVAYIIQTTTRDSGLRRSIFEALHFAWPLLQQAFGDAPKLSDAFDKALSSGSDDIVPPLDLGGTRLLVKHLIEQGDFEFVYQTQRDCPSMDLMKQAFLLEDASTGSLLLNDLLSFCDKKKLPKGVSLLSTDIVNKAGYAHQIISGLFLDIEERVNFFVRGTDGYTLKHTLLSNLITCQLILLSVFNKTSYFDDHRISRTVFKARIEAALLEVLEHPLVFISSFHALYFLAHNYPESHPSLKQLGEDLNLILEVVREGDQKLSTLRFMLLDNDDADFPLASTEVIGRLVDKERWAADQAAAEKERKMVEASLFEETEKPASSTGGKSKKKKKVAATPCSSSFSQACVVVPPSTTLKQTVASMPASSLPEAALPVCASMPPVSEPSGDLKPSMKILPETMAKIERLSELNQRIAKQLEAFRTEIQLHLSRPSTLVVAEQNVFRALDTCLEERQKLTPILRGYFKKARSQAAITFKMDELTTDTFLLPDWVGAKVREHRDLFSLLIETLQSIREDKSSTITIHIDALVGVLRSTSIPMISIEQLRSFQYLLIFRRFLDTIQRDVTPALVRILSNEGFHPLGELAFDAKNFGQLILQVQHWSYLITVAPYQEHAFNDIQFAFPFPLGPREVLNPNHDLQLGSHLSRLLQLWNREVNRFAMALSAVIDSEPDAIFITTMKKFLDKLSHSYFKDRHYACVETVHRLFHPFAQIELFGSQLFMQDPTCDQDLRFRWRNLQDTHESIITKIEAVLKAAGLPKTALTVIGKPRLYYPDGRFIETLNIKIFMPKSFPTPWDLTIFVGGNYFPLVSYVSHAGAILYTETGRVYTSHLFRESILKGQLLIAEPSAPDFIEGARRSRLMHILKCIIRAAYSEPQTRLLLGDSAEKILGVIKAYRSNMAGLHKSEPHLIEALHFLLEKHFKHYEETPAFFTRTAILLAFFQDIGCKLVTQDKGRKLQLCAASSKTLGIACLELPHSEKLPEGTDVSANSFLVLLPEAICKRVSLMLEAPVISAAFFGSSAAAATTAVSEDHAKDTTCASSSTVSLG